MVRGLLENYLQQMTRVFSIRRRQRVYNSSASRIGVSAAAAAAAARWRTADAATRLLSNDETLATS